LPVRFSEPGKHTDSLEGGIAYELFKTKNPIITINRRGSLAGKRRKKFEECIVANDLDNIGDAGKMWGYYMEGQNE
jgi:hypothetical protein